MPESARPVFILDCDNTLLENDTIKANYDSGLRALLGDELTARFWQIYEDARAIEGTVDLPRTLDIFRMDVEDAAVYERVRALIMDYPFADRVYPDTMDTLATLREHGTPVIVSDGDAIYQPFKIERSGLFAAVEGQVRVYIHKQDHLDEIMRDWPASYYVMIDDKASILAATKRLMPDWFVTVHVRQGHYADAPVPDGPAPDITVARIGDVRALGFASLSRYLTRVG